MQRINLPDNNPFYLVFRLYKIQFLDASIRKGLINPRQLSLAGDGTPLETARLERSKRICDCPRGSDCGSRRKFSQPDCNWGWDSSGNKFFSATIPACLLLQIPKTTFLFFLCSSVLPGMTCCPSCILFSPWDTIFLSFILKNFYWILSMMPTLSINTAKQTVLVSLSLNSSPVIRDTSDTKMTLS